MIYNSNNNNNISTIIDVSKGSGELSAVQCVHVTHSRDNIPYERRLRMLNLHSLERRRLRGDLIEVFKWYRGYNKGDVSKILRISNQDRTRNNGFKIEKSRYKKELGKNWFSNRVVDEWNKVSSQVVGVKTIESFKRRLDKYMD